MTCINRLYTNMVFNQMPNHSLVLRLMPGRFRLEEVHAAFAQCERDLDTLFAECQFGGCGQEIGEAVQTIVKKQGKPTDEVISKLANKLVPEKDQGA